MRFLVSVTRFVAIVAATAGLFIVVNAFAAPGDTVADRVFGSAGSFATSTANVSGLSASSLNTPSGIAFDSAGRLYVADFGNYRVLEYDNPLTGATADRVFGQGGSFTTSMCNNGGITTNSFCAPTQLALDAAGHLYVVDSGNSRVLEYDNPLTSQTANRVFGQGGSFTSGTCGAGANGLCSPVGVAVDAAGHLYVADAGNSRVLEYDNPLTSQTANRVLGQGGNFTSRGCNNGGISANSLCGATAVVTDAGGRLYAADTGNSRILAYDNPITSQTAARVFGQAANFTTGDENNGGISASSLFSPIGVAVDGAGHLYIADQNNHRMLEYDTPLTSQTADRVFGQAGSFTTGHQNNGGLSASSLNYPFGVAVASTEDVYVADWANYRVLEYDAPLTSGSVGTAQQRLPSDATSGRDYTPVTVVLVLLAGAGFAAGGVWYLRRKRAA